MSSSSHHIVNRFHGWILFLVLSAICLGSLSETVPKENHGSDENYVIACCAITLIFSFLMVVVHFFEHAKDKIIGNKIEGAVATILLLLWIGCIAVVQSPDNNLAVASAPVYKSEIIINANLYIFSWASFFCTIYLFGSIAQQMNIVDVEASIGSAPPKLLKWYILLAASVIVLGSSVSLKGLACSASCATADDESWCSNPVLCQRTKFAISVGAIDMVICGFIILLTHIQKITLLVEALSSGLALIFYCFGVAFITNSRGPGSSLGNLFFSCWLGLWMSVLIYYACLKEIIASKDSDNSEESNGTSSSRPDSISQEENKNLEEGTQSD